MYKFYDLPDGVIAFTAGKGCHGTEPGVDARKVGVLDYKDIFIPRQTHSLNVCWTDKAGECPDTDAVITSKRGLCVVVKTADCIPVLLYDERQQLVSAIHAGWRGTVGKIVSRTIKEMKSRGEDLYAIIGPGISLEAFEVGDEVYDAFQQAGFPMGRIAKRYPSQLGKNSSFLALNPSLCEATRWHIDLWEANRWLLEEAGVRRIQTAGICTFQQCQDYYSARRESIKTGRNINGIMLSE